MSTPTTKPVHPDNNDAMRRDYDENAAPGGEDLYGADGVENVLRDDDADSLLTPENITGMQDLDGGVPDPGERTSPAEGGD